MSAFCSMVWSRVPHTFNCHVPTVSCGLWQFLSLYFSLSCQSWLLFKYPVEGLLVCLLCFLWLDWGCRFLKEYTYQRWSIPLITSCQKYIRSIWHHGDVNFHHLVKVALDRFLYYRVTIFTCLVFGSQSLSLAHQSRGRTEIGLHLL